MSSLGNVFLFGGGMFLFLLIGAALSLAFTGRPITLGNLLSAMGRSLRWFVMNLIFQIVFQIVIDAIFNGGRSRRRF